MFEGASMPGASFVLATGGVLVVSFIELTFTVVIPIDSKLPAPTTVNWKVSVVLFSPSLNWEAIGASKVAFGDSEFLISTVGFPPICFQLKLAGLSAYKELLPFNNTSVVPAPTL